MKKIIVIILVVCSLFVTLVACGLKSIVGNWVDNDGIYSFAFEEGGDGYAYWYEKKMHEFTYRIEGDKLIIVYDDVDTVNSFVINGDILSITNSSGDTFDYQKQ